ncbi:MAG: cytidylyltransferase domain-containing protein [Candidatus Woesearchaeota archaeon]
MSYKGKKIIAVIPARGGSKGIPGKNIKLLAGKPLIAWTIEEINASGYIDECYVSTDNGKIKEIAKEYGAKIIERPSSISGDRASTELALMHTAEVLNEEFDVLALFQCTSPLRYTYQIDEALEKMFSEEADSLLSGYKNDVFFWDNNGNSINYDFNNRPRRQDKDWEFVENGSFYFTKKEILMHNRNRLGGKISQYIMPKWMSFEIDEPLDFEVIEFLMSKKYSKEKLDVNKLKMILFDVDGIFTDGSVYLDGEGKEMLKFSRIDGKGIEMLKKAGFIIGIISSEDSSVVKNRMNKLKLHEVRLGIKDKLGVYRELKEKYKVKDHEICFCGDDVQDIPVLQKVGLSCCPKNAQEEVKCISKYVSTREGGKGFVREIANRVSK